MVSRVRPGGTAGRDFVIEHRIRTSFPKLVAEGRVIVFDEICSVDYEDEDLKTSPELVACANLGVKKGPQEHANFITPEMDGSLRDYPGSPQTIVGPAVMAAVDMVPDQGPWIIHMDLHPANVLYKVEGDHVRTALADWGRALHIEKPNDIASVRKGIMQWMNSDGDFEGQPLSAYRDALGELDWSVAPHMAALLTDPVVGMEEHLAAIRGWSLDYLLRRLDIEVGDTLLTAPNQAELRKRCLALTGGFSKGGMYWPTKYSRGLTQRQNAQRKRSATRRTKMSWKDPKAYVAFKSDKGVKTRRSSYTQRFHKKYPEAKTLPEIAKATGVSKAVLEKVYDRGMAAWRTGHRPGASQQAWGMARVHSFVLKGKTYRTADKDLA